MSDTPLTTPTGPNISEPSQFDIQKETYKQNCDFYRFQDQLRWSRFQTIIAVEGGLLLALFSGSDILKQQIAVPVSCYLGLFGFIIILCLSCLSLKDGWEADKHKEILRNIESDWNCPKFKDGNSHQYGLSIQYFMLGLLTISNIIAFLVYPLFLK